jgi:hypothetical protein
MTPSELIDLVSRQPEVAVDRVVRVHGPNLDAVIQTGKPLLVSELLSHPDQHSETRHFRYGHILGRGCPDAAIAEWQQRRGGCLSADVVDLLRRIDGIHLWADLDEGRSYFGILPLVGWCNAHQCESALLFENQPPDTFLMSYHDNGDYFLLLDVAKNEFKWFDPQSPDDSRIIGTSVSALLDWWWEYTQELDPRLDSDI